MIIVQGNADSLSTCNMWPICYCECFGTLLSLRKLLIGVGGWRENVVNNSYVSIIYQQTIAENWIHISSQDKSVTQ